jgi:hypothetical protein
LSSNRLCSITWILLTESYLKILHFNWIIWIKFDKFTAHDSNIISSFFAAMHVQKTVTRTRTPKNFILVRTVASNSEKRLARIGNIRNLLQKVLKFKQLFMFITRHEIDNVGWGCQFMESFKFYGSLNGNIT